MPLTVAVAATSELPRLQYQCHRHRCHSEENTTNWSDRTVTAAAVKLYSTVLYCNCILLLTDWQCVYILKDLL